ncbi:(Fe-S)-binding protein [Desulfosarcina sp.]|uniref:(Fe-S)-binding protein n=1 Tax=Desulfosarcina sp. TaxID=2027861 RepID=UPI00397077E7
MEQYTIIKSFVMLMALAGAFTFFFLRVRRLYRLMMAVEGTTRFKLDQVSTRIGVLFKDVLGQANVLRKKWPGIAHTLIFFGFLAVQPHSLELMIKGICPAFEVGNWIPGLYGGYLFVADILAAFVLVGFAYAIYRRTMLRPPYLTLGTDANLIILFTCLIIVTFQFINAFQTLLPLAADAYDYRGIFPVSGLLVPLLGLDTLSPQQVFAGYEVAYWIHMATILSFLVYIPGSKHLHLLAAAPNVFLKPLVREKAIIRTDIENEALETFGLGKVSELNWKNVLNLYACTECGRCEEQCPASNTDKPLSPKKVVHDLKVDLLDHSDAILGGDCDQVKPIVREDSPVTGDVLWSCTTCRACEDICPVNIEHLDFIIEARKHQVLMEASFPPEVQETFTNLENQANPWGFGADSRADWCKGMDVPLMSDNPEAELLWFVGCAGSFDDRGKKISQAMARVLQRAGVDFAILGPEEACNGDMARRAGNEYLAQMLIQQNVETLNGYKPKTILSGCPHCFNIIKNEYPHFGAVYPVVSHAEFLFDLHRQGRLKPNGKSLGNLTFHDSCYLGRWNGIFQPPRDLLRSMNNGQLTEMQRSGEKGFCCGAGGGRMFMEETLGKRINVDRAEEIMRSGAATVAAACPFCATMLSDGLMDKASAVAVKDIAEIVDAATV